VTATVSGVETAPSNQASATTLPQTPPSHLTAVAVSPNQINLNWQTTPMTGVSYNVYYSTTPGVTPSPSNSIGGATTTSFSAQGLQPSTTYYYVVTSVIAFVESAPSNEASAKTLPLVAPSHLAAVAVSTSQINLTWQASPTKGITYNLYVSTAPGVAPSPSNLVGSGIQTTTFSAKGLQPLTTYYYAVTAATPWSESALSNEASAKTFAPSAPSHLTAEAVSASQINLSWDASPTSGVSYNLYASTTPCFTPSPAGLIGSGITTTGYSAKGLQPSTTYYYVVTAVLSLAESTPSNEANAKTLPLVAPSHLTATEVSSSQINLSWQASPTSGVTYNVYSSASSGFKPSPSELIASGISKTAYSDNGLPPSTTRYYLVTASVSGAESVPTNQASAKTAPN
jgi:fibronectin type 3 domain-containing protein